MRPPRTLVIAGLLIVIAAWFVFEGRQSDDAAQIRGLFNEIASEATFEGPLHPLEIMKQARHFTRHFSTDVDIVARYEDQERRYVGQKEIERFAAMGRKELAQAACRVDDLKISINYPYAVATGVGRLMGRTPGRDDYFLEQHRFQARLQNIGGEWLILSVENVPPEWGKSGT